MHRKDHLPGHHDEASIRKRSEFKVAIGAPNNDAASCIGLKVLEVLWKVPRHAAVVTDYSVSCYGHHYLHCFRHYAILEGLLFGEDMHDFYLPEHVAVYVPSAYSVAGNVYVVPKSRVKYIKNVNSTQFMKFAVSGGITTLGDDEKDNKSAKHNKD